MLICKQNEKVCMAFFFVYPTKLLLNFRFNSSTEKMRKILFNFESLQIIQYAFCNVREYALTFDSLSSTKISNYNQKPISIKTKILFNKEIFQYNKDKLSIGPK